MTIKKNLSIYRDVVSNIRIEHDAYANILSELTESYEAVGTTSSPVCILITGESRTGKSSVVKDLLETYLPTRIDGKSICTVVYAISPANATVKSLLESLLYGLGDPFWARGSIATMTQRLYTLLDEVQCKMIILDEFQHLCDKGQYKKLNLLADWLKVLIESRKYGLVAVGLPTAASVVNRHSQLFCRFDEVLKMPLFDWSNKSSASQFRAILGQFQRDLYPFNFPALDSPEMGVRIYLATAGRIGLVAKLLDRVIRNAIRAGSLNIELKDFDSAYKRAIWSANLFPVPGGPFGAEVDKLLMDDVQMTVLQTAAMEEVADMSSSVTVYGNNNESKSDINPTMDPNQRPSNGKNDKSKSKTNKEPRSKGMNSNGKRELRKALRC